MNLQEALKKESIGEAELKVISANMALLSHADKVRLGFAPAEEVVAPKAKRVSKKTK